MLTRKHLNELAKALGAEAAALALTPDDTTRFARRIVDPLRHTRGVTPHFQSDKFYGAVEDARRQAVSQ